MLKPMYFNVGKTRFRNPVVCATNKNEILPVLISCCQDLYTTDDYFDAYCVFEFLIQRSLRQEDKDLSKVALFTISRKIITDHFLNERILNESKAALGLKTSMDVCRYGSKLVNIEFKDF